MANKLRRVREMVEAREEKTSMSYAFESKQLRNRVLVHDTPSDNPNGSENPSLTFNSFCAT